MRVVEFLRTTAGMIAAIDETLTIEPPFPALIMRRAAA